MHARIADSNRTPKYASHTEVDKASRAQFFPMAATLLSFVSGGLFESSLRLSNCFGATRTKEVRQSTVSDTSRHKTKYFRGSG